MNTLKKINRNYKQSLIIMMILFFADFFSFATAKTISKVYKEPPIYIPISFEVKVIEERPDYSDKNRDISNKFQKARIKSRGKNKVNFMNNLKLNDKTPRKFNGTSFLKETSENLIIDILPIVLIGCIVFARKKDFFELKYSY